jgi:hypothetical protein
MSWEADFAVSRATRAVFRDECDMNGEAQSGSGAVQ